jgi:hypothetical protein
MISTFVLRLLFFPRAQSTAHMSVMDDPFLQTVCHVSIKKVKGSIIGQSQAPGTTAFRHCVISTTFVVLNGDVCCVQAKF